MKALSHIYHRIICNVIQIFVREISLKIYFPVRRRSPTRQEYKLDGTTKLNRRSASRNRSPQRQQSQQLELKHSSEDNENKLESDDHNNKTAEEDIDNHHAPDNSGSGSTL